MSKREYLELLKEEIITYRYNLFLPTNVTFGMEIEYEGAIKDYVDYYIDDLRKYNLKNGVWSSKEDLDISEYAKDGSLINGEVSSPILKDEVSTWVALDLVLDVLDKQNAIVTNRCAGHINIGSQVLLNNPESFRNFLLLWKLYEQEIYKFSSGEFSEVRKRADFAMFPISHSLDLSKILDTGSYKTGIGYINSVSDRLFDKIHDISLKKMESCKFKTDNVIEFRLTNSSLRKEIWQNYINFFAKFLLKCNREIDLEEMLYKLKYQQHDAFDLANLVFEDDVDKSNFLIQTLKLNSNYDRTLKIR